MSNFLEVANKLVNIVAIVVLVVLVWKNAEYFNWLKKDDKGKTLIAWDLLVLVVMLICSVMRAVTL